LILLFVFSNNIIFASINQFTFVMRNPD